MNCPICNEYAVIQSPVRTRDGFEGHHVKCDRCGEYLITDEAKDDLPSILVGNPELIARVAYGVCRMQRPNQPARLTTDLADRFASSPLPSVFEQSNNLVRILGKAKVGPGEAVSLNASKDLFKIGARSSKGFWYVVDETEQRGLVQTEQRTSYDDVQCKLSFNGWKELDRLEKGNLESRIAFMAMQYGDRVLDEVVETCFRPAVAKTGFRLIRLDDAPRAGLIDDRLRVEIQKARFLVADLTHDNLGSYWESGYAEGLGKHVIYTCEKSKFKKDKSHFDTNHHLTVIWDKADLDTAAADLKATIRATLPDEAKLTDD